jgi:UDP-N-acetylmuramoylalanine--D-glutamate ligase
VVLILGGRNKGLDLSAVRRAVEGTPGLRVRGVVAIGEAAAEVAVAFADGYEVARAPSMREAVSAAAGLARPGDAVLLSPACASFDSYESYEARGDDFTAAVRALARSGAPRVRT